MAIKYVPYFPNTLEGQAILDNFVRTKRVLRYRDNDQLIERVERGMPLYEMETKETIGTNPNQNKIIVANVFRRVHTSKSKVSKWIWYILIRLLLPELTTQRKCISVVIHWWLKPSNKLKANWM